MNLILIIQFVCFLGVCVLAWQSQSRYRKLVVECDQWVDQWVDLTDRIGDALELLKPITEWDGPEPELVPWKPYCQAIFAQKLFDILTGKKDEG